VVCHIQNEIFAHDGQANEANVTFGLASVASSLDRHLFAKFGVRMYGRFSSAHCTKIELQGAPARGKRCAPALTRRRCPREGAGEERERERSSVEACT